MTSLRGSDKYFSCNRSKTQSYLVRIKIDNSSGALKRHVCRSKLLLDKAVDVIVVPISAVIDEGGRSMYMSLRAILRKREKLQQVFFDDEYIVIKRAFGKEAVIVKDRSDSRRL